MTNLPNPLTHDHFGLAVRATVHKEQRLVVFAPTADDLITDQGLPWTVGGIDPPEYFVSTQDLSDVTILFDPTNPLKLLNVHPKALDFAQKALRWHDDPMARPNADRLAEALRAIIDPTKENDEERL